MFRSLLAAICLCGGLLSAPAALAAPLSGLFWLNQEHQAVIDVAHCGATLCGHIAGFVMQDPATPVPLDWRGQPECGEVILTVTPSGTPDRWQGQILDPRDGAVWQAILMPGTNGALLMHGYAGLPLFGQTKTWALFTGQIATGCRITSTD